MSTRLTEPQIELLTDIATKPQMYITYQSRWDQTARALIRKGLATEHFEGGMHQYRLEITDAGRSEAIRRGIVGSGEVRS